MAFGFSILEEAPTKLGEERGQTSVEYLLLLAMSFLMAYIVVRGPVSTFSSTMLRGIREGLSNVVEYGEMTKEDLQMGQPNHPASAQRLKPLHL